MNTKIVLMTMISLFLGGCSLTPQEQVQKVKVCQSAGLDYAIQQNDLGQTISVDCRKPEDKSNKK